jgi:hypothetical protein
MKSMGMRLTGYVACMGKMRSAYRIFVGKPKKRTPFWRPRRRKRDNVKIMLNEIGYEDVNWIQLTQERVQWEAPVSTVMNLRFP